MAKVFTFFPIIRTRGNLTFYMMDGQNYVRTKSSLTAKKVKTSKRFARTRYYAGLMGKASKIGSSLFQALPARWRQSWMYRTFTGEAMRLLKQGKSEEEARQLLWELYVAEIVSKIDDSTVTEVSSTPRRVYTKRHPSFWTIKTRKATKRKQRREKLRHYAAMLAKASVIASRVYGSIPAYRGKVAFYKGITGLAMTLLKQELDEITVKEILMHGLNPKYVDSLPFIRRGPVMVKPGKRVLFHLPVQFFYYIPNDWHLSHIRTRRA